MPCDVTTREDPTSRLHENGTGSLELLVLLFLKCNAECGMNNILYSWLLYNRRRHCPVKICKMKKNTSSVCSKAILPALPRSLSVPFISTDHANVGQ